MMHSCVLWLYYGSFFRAISVHNYLCQGGFVFVRLCLSVCLCVSKITRKVMDGSFCNFEGMSGMA